MEKSLKNVGLNIEALIIKRGFKNPTNFCDQTGISRTTLHRLMNGDAATSAVTTLHNIATILGVPFWSLYIADFNNTDPDSINWDQFFDTKKKTVEDIIEILPELESIVIDTVETIIMFRGSDKPLSSKDVKAIASAVSTKLLKRLQSEVASDQVEDISARTA